MLEAIEFIVDVDVDVELFTHFPPKRVGERFARFLLSARKLPVASQMRADRSLRHQKSTLPFDDGRHDDQ
ncbi:MAG: hypothetical protein QGI02_02600 [Vicinamibacterales bacterium]|nr:hypothetical protein [Vicinamibacterales bacterium]